MSTLLEELKEIEKRIIANQKFHASMQISDVADICTLHMLFGDRLADLTMAIDMLKRLLRVNEVLREGLWTYAKGLPRQLNGGPYYAIKALQKADQLEAE